MSALDRRRRWSLLGAIALCSLLSYAKLPVSTADAELPRRVADTAGLSVHELSREWKSSPSRASETARRMARDLEEITEPGAPMDGVHALESLAETFADPRTEATDVRQAILHTQLALAAQHAGMARRYAEDELPTAAEVQLRIAGGHLASVDEPGVSKTCAARLTRELPDLERLAGSAKGGSLVGAATRLEEQARTLARVCPGG